MLSISAIVLTYNNEDIIEDTLSSIHGFVDEILVVDSYSTDKTLHKVKKYTAKIFYHSFFNYSQQRNWSQENLPIKNEWIFHLDSGETVSDDLKSELCNAFYKNRCDGFLIPRKAIFMKKWIKYGGLYPTYHLRIFKRNKGYCEDRLYDQHFILDGLILKLKNSINDSITSNFDDWKKKHHYWAVLEACEALNKDTNKEIVNGKYHGSPIEHKRWLRNIYYTLPIFVRPVLYFIYRYFLKFGILDGRLGFMFHFYQGYWFRNLVDINIFKIKNYVKKSKKSVSEVIKDLYNIDLKKYG